jgi:protease-4
MKRSDGLELHQSRRLNILPEEMIADIILFDVVASSIKRKSMSEHTPDSQNTHTPTSTPPPPASPHPAAAPQFPPTPPYSRPMAGRYTPPPYPPPHDYQQPPARSSGCGQFAILGLALLFVFGVVGVCMLVGTAFLFSVATDALGEISEEKTVTERVIAGDRNASEKIAVINVEGVIVQNADGFIARQIRRVMSDTKVKAVVVRVNSPGGTMAGSDYYLYLLNKMKSERRIPVVVSMGTTAASGGYYVSMVGDEIYAEPSTITGSIGVIASLFDASALFEKIGVESTPITSGRHKAMGSFMKPMGEDERAIWQHLIDDNFDRFKKIIREGRKEFADNPEALDKLATGQIYTANEAVANKLIDKIGYLDDAVQRAGRLANLNERDYKVIQYRPKLSFMDTLLESRSPNPLMSEKTLSEITTPKVYLICPYVIPVGGME